jgi:hypothetical protein
MTHRSPINYPPNWSTPGRRPQRPPHPTLATQPVVGVQPSQRPTLDRQHTQPRKPIIAVGSVRGWVRGSPASGCAAPWPACPSRPYVCAQRPGAATTPDPTRALSSGPPQLLLATHGLDHHHRHAGSFGKYPGRGERFSAATTAKKRCSVVVFNRAPSTRHRWA